MSLKARIEALEAKLPKPARWALRLIWPDGRVRYAVPRPDRSCPLRDTPPPGVPVIDHPVDPEANHTIPLVDQDGRPRIVSLRIRPTPKA